MNLSVTRKKYQAVGIIIVVSFILVLPQLILKNMIIGSDALFHFNRLYDTSQQIKEGNFQPFISMYGYQQSGRVVTPIYAPTLSYILGALLLICGNWFVFQVVSNFCLFLLSGISMYALLKKMKIKQRTSVELSLFFMTTYSISYWVIRQGFSSWAGALLPLCLIPVVTMFKDNKYQPISVALSLAVMFQTHFLTSLFLLVFYSIAFMYQLFKDSHRLKVIRQLVTSMVIFLFLTSNIWYALWWLYGNNKILPPFQNTAMFEQTITKASWYWLINPFIMPIMILFLLFTLITRFRKMSDLNKYFSLMSLFFFFLSSNFFPWRFFSTLDLSLVKVMQFPFRFFIPGTVCLICSVGLTLLEKLYRVKVKKISVLIGACIVHSLFLYGDALKEWDDPKSFIQSGSHVVIHSEDVDEVKQSFCQKDLKKSLVLVEKSTPDYLPVYRDSQENNYQLYEKVFFNQKNKFSKTVKNHQLVVEWQGRENEEVIVPVVKYARTTIIYNNQKLEKPKLTVLGSPIVKSRKGANELILYGDY